MSHTTKKLALGILSLMLLPSFASAQDSGNSGNSGNIIDSRIPSPYVATPPQAPPPVAPPQRFVPRPTPGLGGPVAVWRPRPQRPPAVVVAPRPDLAPPDLAIDPAAVRAELTARRQLNVARFRAYAAAGEFPDNHVRPGMLNVFIDDEGKICAAANLIAQDGQLALVQQAARDNNFLRLADVRSGALYEWILASGFTQEEIAMIQEPYAYIEPDLIEEPDLMLAAEDRERQRLQQRFREIDAALVAVRDASIDTAVQRLIAHRLAQRAAG